MTKPAKGSDTLALKVNNTGFLLDRLGQDCAPLQFLRELTQNAIEAVLRTPQKKGEVVWDVDWTSMDLGDYPNPKLCIIDNGDGMTGEEMVHYINQLSSSGGEQSMGGNYGVGAKIAAATRNHAGLLYVSWKNGRGWMIHLWRDPVTGIYGLRQFPRPDGSHGHFTEVEESVKPEHIIQDHGTMIVLLGMDEAANTMQAPPIAASPSRWIAKYLNSRYLSIPAGVEVRAREGWDFPRTDKDRNLLRRVTGQEPYLNEHAIDSGVVELSGAHARWWILRDEPALDSNSGFIESSGHVAALYKGELYEMLNARAGRARLQNFGVVYGTKQVVIYVEPSPPAGVALTTNTARTSLLMGNGPLPWADWEAEFRENMPPAITKLMDDIAAKTTPTDNSKSIRERLKALMDLYKVSRYRATPTGDVSIDEERPIRGGQPRKADTATAGGEGGRTGQKGGTAGGVYALFQKKDGPPGTAVKPDPFPTVAWVSTADGTRNQGDIEDRAARFIPEMNLLQINRDFRVFKDLVDRFVKEIGKPSVRSTVTTAVEGWFEQALVEAVIGVQAMNGAKEWNADNIDKALSEEALTLAVMPRYHVYISVKRELGSKLGKFDAA